jgi:Flp pilus assembly pilin Flp
MEKLRQTAQRFIEDEEGIGTLELLLILAVIVVIAIAFRKWIMKWVGELFNKANSGVSEQTNIDTGSISPPSAGTN